MPPPCRERGKWTKRLEARNVYTKGKVAVADLQWRVCGAVVADGVEGLDNVLAVDDGRKLVGENET